MIIKPEPNETRAASIGFPIRWESSPFARAWSAIMNPDIAAKKSNLELLFITMDGCRGIRAYRQSNP